MPAAGLQTRSLPSEARRYAADFSPPLGRNSSPPCDKLQRTWLRLGVDDSSGISATHRKGRCRVASGCICCVGQEIVLCSVAHATSSKNHLHVAPRCIWLPETFGFQRTGVADLRTKIARDQPERRGPFAGCLLFSVTWRDRWAREPQCRNSRGERSSAKSGSGDPLQTWTSAPQRREMQKLQGELKSPLHAKACDTRR
jgi:hypothetical protein